MSLLRLNTNPSPKQLRLFGLVWLVFFGTAAGLLATRGASETTVMATAALAIAVPLAGWVFPPLMRLVFIGLSYVTFPLGLAVSVVILSTLYYLVFTPMGLLARLFGYDPMSRKFDSATDSYWVERRLKEGVDSYFRQS